MINLPEIDFFETDPQQIISDVRYSYENIVGRTVQESSPEYNFITTMAAWIVLQRQQYEAALKQNLLYYADNVALDHLGAFRMTPRLEAQGSTTTLEFTLSAPQTSAIVIPAGTRATADGITFFATDEALIISPGSTNGRVSATSLQTGESSNNIGVGDINIIVDPIAFVDSVSNTEITLGGRDTETDSSYRDRIYNAPAVFSIAGPREAYVYLAKAANSAIGEVTVYSDMAGNVNVYPLLTNGEIPNAAILAQVEQALDENTVRPLSDNVHVLAPVEKPYDLNIKYFVYTADAGNIDNITKSVNSAIDGWVLWQRMKIGRDINLSELHRRIVAAGAKRLEITAPVTTVVAPNELAVLRTKTVVFGGLEDE